MTTQNADGSGWGGALSPRRGRGGEWTLPPALCDVTPPPHVVHLWFLYGALDSHPFILHRMTQCSAGADSC